MHKLWCQIWVVYLKARPAFGVWSFLLSNLFKLIGFQNILCCLLLKCVHRYKRDQSCIFSSDVISRYDQCYGGSAANEIAIDFPPGPNRCSDIPPVAKSLRILEKTVRQRIRLSAVSIWTSSTKDFRSKWRSLKRTSNAWWSYWSFAQKYERAKTTERDEVLKSFCKAQYWPKKGFKLAF